MQLSIKKNEIAIERLSTMAKGGSSTDRSSGGPALEKYGAQIEKAVAKVHDELRALEEDHRSLEDEHYVEVDYRVMVGSKRLHQQKLRDAFNAWAGVVRTEKFHRIEEQLESLRTHGGRDAPSHGDDLSEKLKEVTASFDSRYRAAQDEFDELRGSVPGFECFRG